MQKRKREGEVAGDEGDKSLVVVRCFMVYITTGVCLFQELERMLVFIYLS